MEEEVIITEVESEVTATPEVEVGEVTASEEVVAEEVVEPAV